MQKIGKLLGIDFGERRIGLSMSDTSQIISTGYKTIDTRKYPDVLGEIQKVVEEYQINAIVMGYPERTDGLPGEKAKTVDEFILKLENQLGLPVYRQDESYSSVRASEILRNKKKKAKQREGKGAIDKVAASIILQDYLNQNNS